MNDSQGDDVSSDVAQVASNEIGETDTSTDTSVSKQTDQQSKESSSAEGTEDLGGKFVPYERFREVNEKAKRVAELEAKLKEFESKSVSTSQDLGEVNKKEQIKNAIKEMGFVPKEEVQEIMRQKSDDDILRQELSRLETTYDGKDGKPKFEKNKVVKFALERQIGDPEAAYKILHEKELVDWQIQQALDKSKGIRTETSDGSGSSNVGTTNDDLKKSIKDGNKDALRTYLKRVIRSSQE